MAAAAQPVSTANTLRRTRQPADRALEPAGGRTRNLPDVTVHASALPAMARPHQLHRHQQEEFEVILDGKAELTFGTTYADPSPRTERLGPGDFIYLSAYSSHMIQNVGSGVLRYAVIRWTGLAQAVPGMLPTTTVRGQWREPLGGPGAFRARTLIEGPTSYLSRAHCHISELDPGAGYAGHTDDHDVAILLLSGRLRTCGRIVEAVSTAFFPAGVKHDMENAGASTARYLVFEFRAPERAGRPRQLPAAWLRDQLRLRDWPGKKLARRIRDFVRGAARPAAT